MCFVVVTNRSASTKQLPQKLGGGGELSSEHALSMVRPWIQSPTSERKGKHHLASTCCVEPVKERDQATGGTWGNGKGHQRGGNKIQQQSQQRCLIRSQALTPERWLAALLECLLHAALLEHLLHAAHIIQTDLSPDSYGKETPRVEVPGSLECSKELTVKQAYGPRGSKETGPGASAVVQ